jgi:hypothetical protein
MSLTQEKNYAQGSRFDPQIAVLFFNELATGKELCSKPLFHFLTSLPQRRETMLMTSVSFFNDLATEKRNYAHDLCFIF